MTPRRAVPTEREAIAVTLAEAFVHDPLYSWMLPDEQSRLNRLIRWFDVQLRLFYLPLGLVWTVEGNEGAALWRRPWRPGDALQIGPALRSIPGELSALGFSSLKKYLAIARAIPRPPREPHWHLEALGVRLTEQGKGIGSALLKPVLNECDEAGTPAYLLNSKEHHLAFYARHGFEVSTRVVVRQAGLPLWTMWRNPYTS